MYARRFPSREISALPERLPKYCSVKEGDRLFQGEILAGLVQVRQVLSTIGTAANAAIEEITHPFSVILTQDCDLEQDHSARTDPNKKPLLSMNVLLCQAVLTTELRGQVPEGKDIWKRIAQNKDERYQCIEYVPPQLDAAGEGIASLGCDFKRYFAVSADELYRRMELRQIKRRCKLVTPYAEHLQSRFCYFLSRLPLAENHDSSLAYHPI